MLIEFRNGRRKEVKEAAARYMIKIGTAKAVTAHENRSMEDKPMLKKQPEDASEIFTPAEELDSAGDAWNPEIHVASKLQNKDGTWRKKPGAASHESGE